MGIYRCGVVPDLKQQDVVRQTLAHVRVMSALQADIAETRVTQYSRYCMTCRHNNELIGPAIEDRFRGD